MQKVSVRTLTLLVELLTAVVSYQWVDWTHSAKPGAMWLAGDCTEARQVQPADPCAAARSTQSGAQLHKAE
jgi:hypothetical protein